MAKTVTYVEMTSRDELVAVAPVPGLTLDPATGDEFPLIAQTLTRIGAPYGWRSARRSRQDWDELFTQNPDLRFWLLRYHGEVAGAVACVALPGHEVEIRTFGLVPEMVGRGLGGYALTLGVAQAWDLAPDTTRVWLHTSSRDNPAALPNYHRRGFRTFKTEVEEDA